MPKLFSSGPAPVLVAVLVYLAQCSAEPDADASRPSSQQTASTRNSGVNMLFGTMPTLEPKAEGWAAAAPGDAQARGVPLGAIADAKTPTDMPRGEAAAPDLPEHLKAVHAWASEPADASRKRRCESHQDFRMWHPHLCQWFLMHYAKPMLIKVINARGGPEAFCSDAAMLRQHAAFCARVATMPPFMAVARPPAKRLSTSEAMGAILQDIIDAVRVETSGHSKLLIQLPSVGTDQIDMYRKGANFAEMTALEMMSVLLLSIAFIVMVAVLLVAICSHKFPCLNRAERPTEIEKHLSLTSDCTI